MQAVHPENSAEHEGEPAGPDRTPRPREACSLPSVHLLALRVPPILEGLHIVEQQPDHAIRLV